MAGVTRWGIKNSYLLENLLKSCNIVAVLNLSILLELLMAIPVSISNLYLDDVLLALYNDATLISHPSHEGSLGKASNYIRAVGLPSSSKNGYHFNHVDLDLGTRLLNVNLLNSAFDPEEYDKLYGKNRAKTAIAALRARLAIESTLLPTVKITVPVTVKNDLKNNPLDLFGFENLEETENTKPAILLNFVPTYTKTENASAYQPIRILTKR